MSVSLFWTTYPVNGVKIVDIVLLLCYNIVRCYVSAFIMIEAVFPPDAVT